MPATMLLTVEETATQLRIARRRLFEMIRDCSLPSVKIGRNRRIRGPAGAPDAVGTPAGYAR